MIPNGMFDVVPCEPFFFLRRSDPTDIVDQLEAITHRHALTTETVSLSEAEAISFSDFLQKFVVEEAPWETLPYSINRGGALVAKTTRRGWATHVYHHPDAPVHELTAQDDRYTGRIFPCEHLQPNEYFVTYLGNHWSGPMIDRGWVVLSDGRILKSRFWDAYGARVRLVPNKRDGLLGFRI